MTNSGSSVVHPAKRLPPQKPNLSSRHQNWFRLDIHVYFRQSGIKRVSKHGSLTDSPVLPSKGIRTESAHPILQKNIMRQGSKKASAGDHQTIQNRFPMDAFIYTSPHTRLSRPTGYYIHHLSSRPPVAGSSKSRGDQRKRPRTLWALSGSAIAIRIARRKRNRVGKPNPRFDLAINNKSKRKVRCVAAKFT